MKKYPTIKLILRIYALAISVFFIFRFILFVTEFDRVDFQEVGLITILEAFVTGVRFDIVIAGYIIILPALILLLTEIFNRKSKIIERIVFYWMALFFTIAFMITATDIPYFNHFFSRLSMSVFEWFDSFSFVVAMILEEPKYFMVMVPLIILLVVFYKILGRIFNRKEEKSNAKPIVEIVFSILFLGLIFLGIRGRIQKKSPITIGTAYYGNHAFLNQLGLNPVFTLMRSYLDSKNKKNATIHLMDEELAISKVQKYLEVSQGKSLSPIARSITPDSISDNKPNVVLIIMESMSAAKMTRHGNPNELTPFLDSLSNQSLYFNNIYTSGKHTFNGVFSSMFSFPALYRQHTMKTIRSYHGLPHVLSDLGYSTTYFTTHDSQFDNVEGFLRANAYEKIVSQRDYPLSEVKTTLGVPDDYMFKFSIPIINDLNENGQPFLVSFMTASDHGPYYIPEYFSPDNSEIKQQIVEYADWSLQQFFQSASKESWFDNTIFVLIADHGAAMSTPYDISLDYHHSPLIFYSPKIIEQPTQKNCIGGQIDLFPTLMGLLDQPYTNNTLGIDLLKETRPFIFINDDDKIGVLSDSLFLIFREDHEPKLYKYRESDKHNYINNFPTQASKMEEYTKANMQVFQYMLTNKETLKE